MKPLRPHTLFTLLTTTLTLSAANAAQHAPDPLHIGTLTVQCHGDHGTPLILIPGLACGSWVWDSTVETLKKDHRLYVVTLAGFDGTPPVKGNLIDLANASLLELIQTQHLDKPILIGHSLGATLSIQFAQQHSNLISGVVAVDGLPVLPGTENMPPDQRTKVAETFRASMAIMTPSQFAAQQLQYMMSIGTLTQAHATQLAANTSRSDPASTAQYLSEDILLDLRPNLASIKVPLLAICPYNPDDYPKTNPTTQETKTNYYRSLLTGTPNLDVVSISPSKHFVMFDQPAAFSSELTRFLHKLSANPNPSPTTKPLPPAQ